MKFRILLMAAVALLALLFVFVSVFNIPSADGRAHYIVSRSVDGCIDLFVFVHFATLIFADVKSRRSSAKGPCLAIGSYIDGVYVKEFYRSDGTGFIARRWENGTYEREAFHY